MKSILTAACHWIKAGLSLTCLKIVVYSKTPDQIVDYHVDLVTTFSAVKKQWEKKEQKVDETSIIIYLLITQCQYKIDHLWRVSELSI